MATPAALGTYSPNLAWRIGWPSGGVGVSGGIYEAKLELRLSGEL